MPNQIGGEVVHILKNIVETSVNAQSLKKSRDKIESAFKDVQFVLEDINTKKAQTEAKEAVDFINKIFAQVNMPSIDTKDFKGNLDKLVVDFQNAIASMNNIDVNINFSGVEDSLNRIADKVDDIFGKMSKSTANAARDITKGTGEIEQALKRIDKLSQNNRNKVLKLTDEALTKKITPKQAEKNVTNAYAGSVTARKNASPWETQYRADVAFVRNYETLLNSGADLNAIFKDQATQVANYYKRLSLDHDKRVVALNNIMAAEGYHVGGYNKAGEPKIENAVQYKEASEPWAREKTLQEVKNILKGGLTVKGGSSNTQDEAPNLNTSKIEGDLNKTIELRMDAEKRAKEAAEKIAAIQEKMQKQGFAIYRGINEEDATESREEGQLEYNAEYWAKDKKTALSYAIGSEDDTHGQLLKTIASPKKPLVLDMEGHEYGEIKNLPALIDALKDVGLDIRSLWAETQDVSPDEIQQNINKFAKDHGYDSVITNNVRDANLEGAPITSTIAVLDDSILSTIQAFDVIEGELRETATKIAEWYHAPDQGKVSKVDGVANEDLEAELAQLRQEQEAATKEIDKYTKKEEKQKKELEKIQSKLPIDTADKKPKTSPASSEVDNNNNKITSGVDADLLNNLNTTLNNLATALNKENSDVKASIEASELSGVLHDGTPYVVDIQEQKNKTINNSDIASIFRELSQLTYEKVGMLNSTTRSISDEFIVGENGRANGSFKDTDGYDTMFHNHPDVEAAIPSAKDLDTFVKKFDNFKKQLIIAGNEVASFDFSKLSSTQLTDIVDIIKSRIKEVKFDKTYMQDVEQYRKEHQGQYDKEELTKRANINARNKWQQRVIQDVFAAHPGVMSVHNIDDFVQIQNPSHDNANSQVFNKLNEVLSNLITILSNTNREKVDSEENNKVSIDTEGLQSVLTAITFKVQDVSEQESVNSSIDQESINNLVGAIKASITPQSDGESKATAPWAKDETLRNITGNTLGKIANSIPKVDVKGLATNDVLNRVAQATEAINGKISGKITGSIKDIAESDKAKKDAKKAKEEADHKAAVQQLESEYKELGKLRAQRDAMPSSTERVALQQDIKSRGAKLRRKGISLGVDASETKKIADDAQAEEAAAIATRKHKEEYDKLIEKIKERNKEQEKLAGSDKDSKFAKDVQARIDGMNGEIDLIQQKIKLTKEEQAEVDKLNAKRDNVVNDKRNKKQDQADAKRLREEIKEARKQNNLDIADSTYNAARKTMASLWQLDPSIDPQSIPQVQVLQSEMTKLDATYKQINDKVRAGQTLSDEEIRDLQDSSNAVAQKTTQLKELIKNYTDLQNGETIGQYVGGAGSEQEQLLNAINDRFGGKAKIKEYRQNADGTLTAVASVKTGTRAFTEYSVAVSQADKKIKMLTGTTKQLPGFFDNVKRKFYEITQYVSAMSLISRATQELRKGIQYVRDIDLALTELKKVTNETEETYDKFLDTASKTAAKVGSTIKDVISSTADWARLNI